MRILAFLDLTSSHGRGVWNGMCRFARESGDVEIVRSIRDNQLTDTHFHGAVCHIARPELFELAPHAVMPVVNVSNRYVGLPYPQVITDEREVGRAVFKHFFEMGHRNFAFFGIQDHNYAIERSAGMRDAAEAAGVNFLALPRMVGDFDYAVYIERFMDQLEKAQKPVAVLACNDIAASRLLSFCKARGIQVPKDVALMGVDNDVIYCEVETPFISSVELNVEAIGYEAARMVVALIRKQNLARRVLVAHKGFVIRQSSGELAVNDAEIREVVAWIREGVKRGVRVPDILRHFPMSRRSLELRFQKTLGTTPSEFIRRERIAHAGRLLSETDTPIKEVAFKCGFSDPRQFSKIFKRVMKKSPSDYRDGQNVRVVSG